MELRQERETKEERQKKVVESSHLETHRFMASRDPELKERMQKLQDVIKEMKAEDPAIISLGLHGSFAKGYATKKSDIDGILFVDAEKAEERLRRLGRIKNKEQWSTSEFFEYYYKPTRRKIEKGLSVKECQTDHVSIMFLNKENIRRLCTLDDSDDYLLDGLEALFMMAVGSNDIREYRQIMLDELEQQGEEGERKWRRIINNLHRHERGDMDLSLSRPDSPWNAASQEIVLRHHDLYPQTIKEAKEYFL